MDFGHARNAAAAIFISDNRAASRASPFSELVLYEMEQPAGLTKLIRTYSDQWSHTGSVAIKDKDIAKSLEIDLGAVYKALNMSKAGFRMVLND